MKRTFLLLILFIISCSIIYSQTWTEQNSGVSSALNSVSAFDINYVWVCGASGTVLMTSNGGANWNNVASAPISNTLVLYNIFSADTNTALVTGSSSSATFVFRTTNRGVNWTQVFTQQNGFINAIWMGNTSAGFMYGNPVGGRWSLWGTINGGITWDSAQFRLPQSGNETGFNNSFYFDPNLQSVWFGTNNTRIYRSFNLIIWSTEPTTSELNSSAIWFTNSFAGMTGGTELLLTTNSGITWNPTPSLLPGSAAIIGITGINNYWWVVREASVVYYTNNNGTNWVAQYTAPSGNYTHMTMSHGNVPALYAVRDNGGISKGSNLVGIRKEKSKIRSYYNLKQNYPNPFNPTTKIEFEIPISPLSNGAGLPAEASAQAGGMDVKLTIYDVLGCTVANLVNEKLQPGTYSVNFNGSNLPSGTYFYTLSAGEFHQTLKMELIK